METQRLSVTQTLFETLVRTARGLKITNSDIMSISLSRGLLSKIRRTHPHTETTAVLPTFMETDFVFFNYRWRVRTDGFVFLKTSTRCQSVSSFLRCWSRKGTVWRIYSLFFTILTSVNGYKNGSCHPHYSCTFYSTGVLSNNIQVWYESSTTVATFQSFCWSLWGVLGICWLGSSYYFTSWPQQDFFSGKSCKQQMNHQCVFVQCSTSVFYQRIYHFSRGDGLIDNLMSVHQMAEWLCQLAFSGRLPDWISVERKGWRDPERAAS